MNAVGSAASLGQLAVYVHCAATRLRHLYETFKTATLLARSQLEELHVLLEILDRIEKYHSPSDTELLVPVLISIADAVQTLRNWYDPSSILRLKWNLIAHQADIEEVFKLLRQKYNLLVFYYSERNNCALSRIESILNAHYHPAPGSSENMSSPKTQDSPTLKEQVQSEPVRNLVRSNETSPRHEQLMLFGANSTSGHTLSDAETNDPRAGMQPAQSPGHGEEGQSRDGTRPSTKIKVSGNSHFMTNTRLFNNTFRPDRNFEGEYNDNALWAGTVDIGNEEVYHNSKEGA